MYRWVTEYIEMNTSNWEYNIEVKEQKIQRIIDNWDKQNRLEKIKRVQEQDKREQQECDNKTVTESKEILMNKNKM